MCKKDRGTGARPATEALRMSLGLILVDDVVDVYVLDRKLQPTEESTLHLGTLQEMEVKIYKKLPGKRGYRNI